MSWLNKSHCSSTVGRGWMYNHQKSCNGYVYESNAMQDHLCGEGSMIPSVGKWFIELISRMGIGHRIIQGMNLYMNVNLREKRAIEWINDEGHAQF